MNAMKDKNHVTGRREFISRLSAAAAMGLVGVTNVKGASLAGRNIAETVYPQPGLPTIALGPHRISRLICGSNPILGYSYMSPSCFLFEVILFFKRHVIIVTPLFYGIMNCRLEF